MTPTFIEDYPRFRKVILVLGVDYQCITLPFASPSSAEAKFSDRLACLRHAASVHPEPGSNSLLECKESFKLANPQDIIFIRFASVPPPFAKGGANSLLEYI